MVLHWGEPDRCQVSELEVIRLQIQLQVRQEAWDHVIAFVPAYKGAGVDEAALLQV